MKRLNACLLIAPLVLSGVLLNGQELYAEFLYIPPEGSVSVSTLSVDDDDGVWDLARALKQLSPPGLTLRFDHRVDTARVLDKRTLRSWESVIHQEGLTYTVRNGDFIVYPKGVNVDDIQLVASGTTVGDWSVINGMMLSEVLEKWGRRASVEVVFLTDHDYLLETSHTFRGTYKEAVQALLFSLGNLPYPPRGSLAKNGRVLAIHHTTKEIAQ